MNQNAQFEERQSFEKQSFEHQNDEQTKNALNQQWNQLIQRAKARLEMIDELHSVVATQSRVVYEMSHPEGFFIALGDKIVYQLGTIYHL